MGAVMESAKQTGKTFDEKVWDLIIKVPKGKVTTYKEIANTLNIRAYRVVGMACNRSPGMPKVPCHRVVASDGRLHGFGSGIENKRKLLDNEGIMMKKVLTERGTDYKIENFDSVMHYLAKRY